MLRNPFRKAWGLQTDGDLWEQAWLAVLKRGANNQDLRQIKGHATDKHIQEGKATREDKIGNDKSDELADEWGYSHRRKRPSKAWSMAQGKA